MQGIFFITAATCLLTYPLITAPGMLEFQHAMNWFFVNWVGRFPALLEQFRDAFLSGIPYPRWVPNLVGGNGYPTFLFYQPGAFFTALPFAILLQNPVSATNAAVIGMTLWGGAGAYFLARRLVGPFQASIVAALFICNPYAVINLYVRADISELFAMHWCPWVILCAHMLAVKLRDGQRCMAPAAGLIGSGAATILTHPFVGIHMVPVMLVLCAALWIEYKLSLRFAGILALCAIGTGFMLTPYAIPVLQLRNEIDYSGIQFTLLTWLRPATEFLLANPAGNLLGLIGLYACRRSPFAWGVFIAWLWIHAVQTIEAEWLWLHVEPLRLTQLPYRALSVDATLRILTYAYGFKWLAGIRGAPRRGSSWYSAAAGIAVILASAVWPIAHPEVKTPLNLAGLRERLVPASYPAFVHKTARDYSDLALAWDFKPRRADVDSIRAEARPLAWIEPPDSAVLAEREGHDMFRLRFRLSVGADLRDHHVLMHIRQLYLTGWAVTINGIKLPPAENLTISGNAGWGPDNEGRIRIWVTQPGIYDIDAWYDGPPRALERNLAAALGLFAVAIALYAASRPRQPLQKSHAQE